MLLKKAKQDRLFLNYRGSAIYDIRYRAYSTLKWPNQIDIVQCQLFPSFPNLRTRKLHEDNSQSPCHFHSPFLGCLFNWMDLHYHSGGARLAFKKFSLQVGISPIANGKMHFIV